MWFFLFSGHLKNGEFEVKVKVTLAATVHSERRQGFSIAIVQHIVTFDIGMIKSYDLVTNLAHKVDCMNRFTVLTQTGCKVLQQSSNLGRKVDLSL